MARRPRKRPSAEAPDDDWSDTGLDAIGVVDLVGRDLVEPDRASDADPDPGPKSDDFAERLVRRYLRQLENEKTRARMLRLLRSSFSSARQGRVFYKVLAATVVNPVARAAGLHASAMRWELVLGQLNGMAIMRYVLKVEPLASAPAEDVVAQLAPAIRATLKG